MGQRVKMSFHFTNTSSSNCQIGIGPSIGFSVTNSKGGVVWNQCYVNDSPGACPLFLVRHTVASKATLAEIGSWDQRESVSAGGAPEEAPPGSYKVTYGFDVGGTGLEFRSSVFTLAN